MLPYTQVCFQYCVIAENKAHLKGLLSCPTLLVISLALTFLLDPENVDVYSYSPDKTQSLWVRSCTVTVLQILPVLTDISPNYSQFKQLVSYCCKHFVSEMVNFSRGNASFALHEGTNCTPLLVTSRHLWVQVSAPASDAEGSSPLMFLQRQTL